jgi:hypothetical protein
MGNSLDVVSTGRIPEGIETYDWESTPINSLTANTPTEIRTPIHFPSDRECRERISTVVGRVDLSEVTYGWIKEEIEATAKGTSEDWRPWRIWPALKSRGLVERIGETEGCLLAYPPDC